MGQRKGLFSGLFGKQKETSKVSDVKVAEVTFHKELAVGDYFIRRETQVDMEGTEVTDETYRIVAITDKGFDVLVDESRHTTMTGEEFLAEFVGKPDDYCSKPEPVGVEIIPTEFGEKECTKYLGSLLRNPYNIYVGLEDGIVYKAEYIVTVLGTTGSSVTELYRTNML